MARLALVIFTLAWWSLVLFSSSDAASGHWTRQLLAELFGLSGHALNVANLLVRKAGHVLYYGVLGFLFARTVFDLFGARLVRSALLAASLAVATAVFDEARQSLSAARDATVWDLIYDGVGLLTGLWIYLRAAAHR